MLYYQTIDSKTLELLKSLQNIPDFEDLRLVGGTSLALQYGHRKSIDIDLFGNLKSDEYEISKKLNQIGIVIQLQKSKNINIYSINGIKVDIVNYHYKWLLEPLRENDLILAHPKDIGAMKLAAIVGRGTKKDFVDLYFLLQEYSLTQLLEFYSQKYHDGSKFLVLKSLSYFDDADSDIDPVMLKPISWEKVKNYIKLKLKRYFT